MSRNVFLSRREILAVALAIAGCRARPMPGNPAKLPDQLPGDPPPDERFSDSVDALFDVLLPAELDADGALLSVGARETGADQVMETQSLVKLLIAQGLIGPLEENVIAALDDLRVTARASLNVQLDLLAQQERPDTAFRHLSRPLQEKVVQRAFDDDAMKPVMQVLRAVCFVGWLGGTDDDRGLRELGFPAFAQPGQLESSGFSDYSFDRDPGVTPGDDLSAVMTSTGDLT
ncbi:MAG: hypothetical protein QM723_03450 [Myxococcaceae bacterium]